MAGDVEAGNVLASLERGVLWIGTPPLTTETIVCLAVSIIWRPLFISVLVIREHHFWVCHSARDFWKLPFLEAACTIYLRPCNEATTLLMILVRVVYSCAGRSVLGLFAGHSTLGRRLRLVGQIEDTWFGTALIGSWTAGCLVLGRLVSRDPKLTSFQLSIPQSAPG